MKLMSHRQRIQAALDHEEPDLVPLDFATGGNSSPVPEAYEKLAGVFKIKYQGSLIAHIMRLATVDERILKALDIDTRAVPMKPARIGVRKCQESNQFYDDWGVKWKEVKSKGTIYHELAESPLAEATMNDLDSYAWWPNPLDSERYAGVLDEAEYLFNQTDYSLVGTPGFNTVWERTLYLCGFSRMLESLVLDPQFVHAVLGHVTRICKSALGHYLALVGSYVQIVKLGDDLGSQDGPQMSPKIYREIIKPYHKEMFDMVKEHSNAKVFLHSCGSVYRLIPELIDAGVEVLNPVQVSAKDMDTIRLKQEFGDRLTFMGAIDTQKVLPFGTSEDVKREVETRIAHLAPGGGFILAPVHNIQAEVPPENVITMYHHARLIGRYPMSLTH